MWCFLDKTKQTSLVLSLAFIIKWSGWSVNCMISLDPGCPLESPRWWTLDPWSSQKIAALQGRPGPRTRCGASSLPARPDGHPASSQQSPGWTHHTNEGRRHGWPWVCLPQGYRLLWSRWVLDQVIILLVPHIRNCVIELPNCFLLKLLWNGQWRFW